MAKREIDVRCPSCESDKTSKNGINKTGKQVYRCNNQECERRNFVEEYTYNGYNPTVRNQVLDMTVNGNGTRAIGRILGISKDTVTAIFKKQKIGIGK